MAIASRTGDAGLSSALIPEKYALSSVNEDRDGKTGTTAKLVPNKAQKRSCTIAGTMELVADPSARMEQAHRRMFLYKAEDANQNAIQKNIRREVRPSLTSERVPASPLLFRGEASQESRK
jgi:hypothetical protein